MYEATTKQIVENVVDGFNGAVFAYGQTSSGKTHTMHGTPDEPGVIPLAVEDVFDFVRRRSDAREFLIRASYLEIYNEKMMDLFADDADAEALAVREDTEGGTYVSGLREEIVTTTEEVLALLKLGAKRRHVGATNMNAQSSRSHTIFRMRVESRTRDADTTGDAGDAQSSEHSHGVLIATLNLVDLAGSERQSKTGAEGQRAVEGAHINKSLMTLGVVIHKLSQGVESKGGHIPYRDSKLTRILQPALGGNSKTSIVCAMTPSAAHVDESHSTLRFASRAKRVVNNATVNEVVMTTAQFAAMIKRQQKEIQALKKRLVGEQIIHQPPCGDDVTATVDAKTTTSMSAMTPETERAVKTFEDKIKTLERDRDGLKAKFKSDLERAETRAANAERESAEALGVVASLRERIADMVSEATNGDDADRVSILTLKLAQAQKAREDAESKLDEARAEALEEKTKRRVAETQLEKSNTSISTHTSTTSTTNASERERIVKQQETIALQRERIDDVERMLDEAIKGYEDEVAARKTLQGKYDAAKRAYAALQKEHKETKRQMHKLTEVYARLRDKCAGGAEAFDALKATLESKYDRERRARHVTTDRRLAPVDSNIM